MRSKSWRPNSSQRGSQKRSLSMCCRGVLPTTMNFALMNLARFCSCSSIFLRLVLLRPKRTLTTPGRRRLRLGKRQTGSTHTRPCDSSEFRHNSILTQGTNSRSPTARQAARFMVKRIGERIDGSLPCRTCEGKDVLLSLSDCLTSETSTTGGGDEGTTASESSALPHVHHRNMLVSCRDSREVRGDFACVFQDALAAWDFHEEKIGIEIER